MTFRGLKKIIRKDLFISWKWGFLEGLISAIILIIFGIFAVNPFIFMEHYFMMFWVFVLVPFILFLQVGTVMMLFWKKPKAQNPMPDMLIKRKRGRPRKHE